MNMKKLIILLFVVLFTQNQFAQSFTASVRANSVNADEQFEISFTFSGSDVNSLSNFQPPPLKDFVILSGPNQSTSMQIINGAVSGSRTFSYYLQARSTGKFVIPAASINSNNSTYKTEPITIEVVKGSAKPKTQQNETGISTEEIAENLFIRAVVDKNSLFKGEQLTVVYKLYTRLNIASPQITKLPSYQGFWAEELEASNNISFTKETIDGKVYNVGVLKRVALFPSQSGELSVTPFELKIPVQIQTNRRTNSIFDDFFNDPFFGRAQTVEFTAKSNTVKVKVLPLPSTEKKDFKGAVGNYTVNASVDKQTVKQNEPISLKITLNGSGNIKLLELPAIQFPNGFETYDPKINDEVSRSGVVSGKKTFEYLLIPRISGKFEIAPVTITFFNPQKKEFVNLSSQAFSINVEQGSAEYSGNSNISKEEIKMLDQDIRYIKTSFDDIEKDKQHLYSSWFFVGMIFFPLLILSGLLIWKKKDDSLSANIILMRNLKAQKVAKTRLKMAANFLKQSHYEKFYEEISKALYGYLEDKLVISKSEFTIDLAVEELKRMSVNEEIIVDLKETLHKSEYIRYSPSETAENESKSMYGKTTSLIILLEEKLPASKRGLK